MAGPSDSLVELYELMVHVPSSFGRIVYIANLWNPETSRYDRGLPERFRSPESDSALAKWHYTFFVEWLALPLPEKQRDVALYRSSNPDQSKTIRELGEGAIPPLVRAEERKLFIQDLSFISALL
jgi:hypothetical protein